MREKIFSKAVSMCFSSQPLAFYLGKTRQVIGSSAALVNQLACLPFSGWIKAFESVTTEDSVTIAITPPKEQAFEESEAEK